MHSFKYLQYLYVSFPTSLSTLCDAPYKVGRRGSNVCTQCKDTKCSNVCVMGVLMHAHQSDTRSSNACTCTRVIPGVLMQAHQSDTRSSNACTCTRVIPGVLMQAHQSDTRSCDVCL